MQASQDGDAEMVKILTRQESLDIDHASKVGMFMLTLQSCLSWKLVAS